MLKLLITPEIKKDSFQTSNFLDFDKREKVFYNNMYLEDFKFVIKMPCVCITGKNLEKNLRMERFDLSKYTYLISF